MEAKFSTRAKITKRSVDAKKPKERASFIWDTDTKGFGLKVTPAGKKVYIFQYRFPGEKYAQKITIGEHGDPWTADKARAEAEKYRGDVRRNINPAQTKRKAKEDAAANITLAQLCDEYLREVPFIPLPRVNRPKKASSIATDKSNIERHIKPLLGRKRIRNIARKDIERFQKDVAIGKTATDEKTGPRGRAIVKGGRGIAARATAGLGAIFSFAIKQEYISSNPVKGVVMYKSEQIDRSLKTGDISVLGDALIKAEREGTSQTVIAAIRLLILSGCRKSEILSLQWAHVDFEKCYLRLPDSKTGGKIVPLGAPALELLAALPRIEKNPYVLPGAKEGGHLVGLQKAWEKIRSSAGLDGVRLHDLRHSFATVAVAGGDSLFLVGKVLGHKQSSTTEIYASAQQDPMQAVADRAAKTIDAAMKVKPEKSGEVIQLPKRKA